jgi:hypothetical protein
MRYPRDYDEVTALQLPELAQKVAYELVAARTALLRRAQELRDVADHVERMLGTRDAPSINGLGELQQIGSQFDAACAEYALAAKLFEAAMKEAGTVART